MAEIKLTPLAGMNNVAEDPALMVGGDTPRVFVREAVNVNLTKAGRAELRPGAAKVSGDKYRSVWQSPLHGDVFGTLGAQWVKIDPATWAHEVLADVGEGDVFHEVLNNLVCVATPSGIYSFDGAKVERMGLDTPAAPYVVAGEGSLNPGTYGVAVAWIRGSLESALSAASFVEVSQGEGLQITLPLSMDLSVTGAVLYLTTANGGELLREYEYPLSAPTIMVTAPPKLGRPSQFANLSPMPSGKYLKYWNGRLLTAKANVLRFSEALAYHLHSERYGFVQMAQRITFVQPVDGGIWVGQVNHVAFLQGSTLENLQTLRKSARAPVPGSAILVDAEVVGTNASPDGSPVAVWLAENGYVLGASGGSLSEIHAGVMTGITARAGTSVVLDRRLITAVT